MLQRLTESHVVQVIMSGALAVLFVAGCETVQDLPALQAIQQAASQGDADAMTQLGYRYDHGLGVGMDHEQAIQWYHRAAERGDLNALLNLGILYLHGRAGIDRDDVEAYKWLSLAHTKSYGSRNFQVQWRSRDLLNELSRMLTSVGIENALSRAKEWERARTSGARND